MVVDAHQDEKSVRKIIFAVNATITEVNGRSLIVVDFYMPIWLLSPKFRGGQCVPCDKPDWLLIFGAIAITWLYTLLTRQLSKASSGAPKVAFFFVQTGLFMIGSVRSISWLSVRFCMITLCI
jgi:hypothetical protein